jgi:hypothetical protein
VILKHHSKAPKKPPPPLEPDDGFDAATESVNIIHYLDDIARIVGYTLGLFRMTIQ